MTSTTRRAPLRGLATIAGATALIGASLAATPAVAESWGFVDGPPISCSHLRFFGPESAMMHGQVHLDAGALGGIVRTTDGGRTWDQITGPVDFEITQVEFLGSQVFIAFGTDTSGRPQDWGPAMHRSDDGGESWELIAHPADSGRITFDDPESGIFVAPNGGGIWTTTDGGRTWSEGGSPLPDYEDSVRAAWTGGSFFVPRGSFVQGDRAVYAAGANLGTTLDAGATWSFFELGQHTNGEFPSNLQSGEFASESVIYAFAERAPQNPIPYHSVDGGVSWAPCDFERPADQGFNTDNRCVDALAPGLAYAATDMSSFDPQPMMRLGDPASVEVPDLDPWSGGSANNGTSGGDAGAGGGDTGTTNGGADGGGGGSSAGGDDGGCSVVGSGDAGSTAVLVGALWFAVGRRRRSCSRASGRRTA